MTTTRDRHHPAYCDEADTRLEVARVVDVCASCRRCSDVCDVFPAMFRIIDARGGGGAAQMTPNEQDAVLAPCHGCGLCTLGCPHGPGRHRDDVDLHATIERWWQMRRANGLVGLVERLRRARRHGNG